MKDSEDKEHRISNLKNMINNIKDDDNSESFESDEDIEEDIELIDYLNEDTIDYDTLGIDDEYIYRPGDEDSYAVNLEENKIDEEYLIKTPKTEENEENNDFDELEELNLTLGGDISENFDNVINAQIGGKPILGIVSSILGVILIIISIFIFESRSDRIIDNVVAGESNFLFVIFLVTGLLFIIYGLFKLFNIINPFENMASHIDTAEKEEVKKETPKKEEKTPTLKQSNIPLDKESYKIGEFKLNDLGISLKKQLKTKNFDETPEKNEESSQRKDLITKEIEEIEYEEATLEGETIDEIFAEIDDMDELEKISEDKSKNKDK